MPESVEAQHWVDDESKLQDHITAAFDDCRLLNYEDDDTRRNFYSRPTAEAPTAKATQANWMDELEQSLSLLDGFARQGGNLTLEVHQAAKSMVATPLSLSAVPVGADAKVTSAAKVITKAFDGILEENNFYEGLSQDAFDSLGHSRHGITKVWAERLHDADGNDTGGRRFRLGDVDPRLLFYHQGDRTRPYSVYEFMYIPRNEAIQLYPHKEDFIRDLPRAEPERVAGVDDDKNTETADVVLLIDCYTRALPGKAGKHVVLGSKAGGLTDQHDRSAFVAQSEILNKDTTWKHEFLPYANLKWMNDRNTWHGRGIGRLAGPYHRRADWILSRKIAMLEMSVPRVKCHERATVSGSGLSRKILGFFKWSSEGPNVPEPTIETVDIIPDRLLDESRIVREECYQVMGVNLDAAMGTRPAGVNAAVAMREWIEGVERRLRPYQIQWELYWKQIGRIILGMMPEVFAEKGARVRSPGSDLYIQLPSYSELGLTEDNAFEIQVKVHASLGRTLTGLLESTLELESRQMISRGRSAMAVYERVPDIGGMAPRAVAGENLADTLIDMALEGKWRTPPATPEFVRDFLPTIKQEWLRVVDCEYKTPGKYSPTAVSLIRKMWRVTEWHASQMTPAAPITGVAPIADATPADVSLTGTI